MDEEVGYEEYTWKKDERGYLLEVFGGITKPIPLEITKLEIRLDKNFIPSNFYFKGSIGRISQEIKSTITDGNVENVIRVSDQERKASAQVRRNAFLLPNSIFSSYLVITKRFRCQLQEQIELSAYIIPHFEMYVTLEPREDSPCVLIMKMSGIKIELETDSEGNLNSIIIPSQKLKIIQSIF